MHGKVTCLISDVPVICRGTALEGFERARWANWLERNVPKLTRIFEQNPLLIRQSRGLVRIHPLHCEVLRHFLNHGIVTSYSIVFSCLQR